MNPISLIAAIWFALAPTTAYAQNIMPPVMLCIVQHESGGQQFTADGSPLWSPTHDVGLFQINESWIPTAKKMGLDVVNSEQDNITFAYWLMTTRGLNQWTTYKDCKGSESS